MSSIPRPPPPRRQPWLATVCHRCDLTVRGVWVLLVAVALVLLSAAASYVFLFPEPAGAAAILAAGVGAVGLPLLVAGVCGLVTDRQGPLSIVGRGSLGRGDRRGGGS